MKRTSNWILAATACLTLSVAQSAAQDAQAAPKQDEETTDAQHQRHMAGDGKMGHMGGKAHMDHMSKELGLTDAQQAQLKSIHEQERTKAMELRNNDSLTREQKMEQFKALRENTQSQVNNVLTADQQKKFSEMKAHHKGRMGRHHRARRGAWGDKQGDAPQQDSTQR